MTAEQGRFVVDASVAVKWFVRENLRREALQLLLQHPGRLLAPDFLLAEVANVFLKKIRAGEVRESFARGALARIERNMVLASTQPLARPAFVLAHQYTRSVYDALYVALALQQGCQLVTADERLYNALRPALPETMLWVGDLPALA